MKFLAWWFVISDQVNISYSTYCTYVSKLTLFTYLAMYMQDTLRRPLKGIFNYLAIDLINPIIYQCRGISY